MTDGLPNYMASVVGERNKSMGHVWNATWPTDFVSSFHATIQIRAPTAETHRHERANCMMQHRTTEVLCQLPRLYGVGDR
jgi:hypothetical protein